MSATGGLTAMIFAICLRSLQVIMALVALGMYGTDLNTARKHNLPGDTRWIYAEIIAGIACLTVFVYMLPFIKSHRAFAWDALLFIFWIAAFGTFANLYLHKDPHGDANVQRMKNAIWVDLFNVSLWFISAVFGALKCLHERRAPPPMSKEDATTMEEV